MKTVWYRGQTKAKLHESKDLRKDLVNLYDYDELVEDMDDEQVADVVDSDARFDAMDDTYYDEDVRPKIEAQTYDGIVLLVERPEEEEKEEESEEEPEVEESLNESEDEYPEDEKEDELPPLEGMAILADEIPNEFPDAKIVDDGDGFVLEDGDKKYDMYAIPEDNVNGFIENCMDTSVEESLELYEDDDVEVVDEPELSIEEIDSDCDFSKVPEFCERIVGEPQEGPEEESEEEPEEEVEEGLNEASVKSGDVSELQKEIDEVNSLVNEYGFEYFTAMPFSAYDNDSTTFEYNYPQLAKLWRSFFKEVVGLNPKDDAVCDETWDTDIDQTDWNTVMKAAEKMASKGGGNVQLDKQYATERNATKEEPVEEPADDEYTESINEVHYDNEDDYYDAVGQPMDLDDAMEDIDDFLENEITIEAFDDFDKDDLSLGREEWINQVRRYNFDIEDLIQDWREKYNPDTVEDVSSRAEDYFIKRCEELLGEVWDYYAGKKESLNASPASEESVDPSDNLTESYSILEKFKPEEPVDDFEDVDNKVNERREKVHNAYYSKMRAQDDEFDEYDTPVNEEVLNRVSREYGYDVGRLRDELKNKKRPIEEAEGDGVEAAADAVNAEEVIKPSDNKGEIYNALDKSLKTAKTKMALLAKRKERSGDENLRAEDFPNVLFIGGAGVGKTAQIKSWAKENGINLFILQGSSLDAADMGGLPYIENGEGQKVLRAQKVGTGILDQLDRPNSVLFLDELNRARQDVRAALLQLINEHIVQDYTADGGMRYFPNFLFTVAAINPSGKAGYQTYELDPAEKGRFRNINVGVENDVTMNYLVKKFTEEAEDLKDIDPSAAYSYMGKAQLAKTIIGNKGFDFDSPESAEENEDNDDWNGLETTPRNLTLLLDNSDGTKDDVLNMWNQYCNNLQQPLVKRILANYKDIENKANDVFKKGTDSNLLNKRQGGGLDRLRNKYGA